MLDILKEKVQALVTLAQKLKADNDLLLQEKKSLQFLYDEEIIRNKLLTYEYEELKIDFILLQESQSEDNSKLEELAKGQSEAKSAVDTLVNELIESIDKIALQEAQ